MSQGQATCARLELKFQHYWVSARGSTLLLDTSAYRCDGGCPAMPMSVIKGRLRETAAYMYGEGKGTLTNALFGDRGDSGSAEGQEREGALVRFPGEARLPEGERRWFADEMNRAARAQLFRASTSTAINGAGVAREKSLRTDEVCVPLTLEAWLHLIGDWPFEASWVSQLDAICAATPSFGKAKRSGFGRVTATCRPWDDNAGKVSE